MRLTSANFRVFFAFPMALRLERFLLDSATAQKQLLLAQTTLKKPRNRHSSYNVPGEVRKDTGLWTSAAFRQDASSPPLAKRRLNFRPNSAQDQWVIDSILQQQLLARGAMLVRLLLSSVGRQQSLGEVTRGPAETFG